MTNKNRYIYFNNATTSFPKSQECIDAYVAALSRLPLDVRHVISEEPDIDRARRAIAEYIGVAPTDVFFSTDATTGLNIILQGYLRPNDICLVDNRSHNSVTRTLYGIGNTFWHAIPLMNLDDTINVSAFTAFSDGLPTLVCITHASNVTGSIYDVGQLIEISRRHVPSAAILIDASQSAGVADLNILGAADFAVFSAHKFLYAPPGAAVVMAKHPLRQTIFGGTGIRSDDLRTHEHGKSLVEVGTPNLPAIASLERALSVAHDSRDLRDRQVSELTAALWHGLSEIPGLTLFGRPPGESRTSVVSFSAAGISPEREWMPYLHARGIIARGGLHCCPLFHEQAGLLKEGTVRFSPGIFSTLEEVSMVVRAVGEFMPVVR